MPPRAKRSGYILNLSRKVNYLLWGWSRHLCLVQNTANLPRDKRTRQGNITGPWLRQWGCSARGTTPGVRATWRKKLRHSKREWAQEDWLQSVRETTTCHSPILAVGAAFEQQASPDFPKLRTTAGSLSPKAQRNEFNVSSAEAWTQFTALHTPNGGRR